MNKRERYPRGHSDMGRAYTIIEQRQFANPGVACSIPGKRANCGIQEDFLEGHNPVNSQVPSFSKVYGNEKMISPTRYAQEEWTTTYGNKFFNQVPPKQSNLLQYTAPKSFIRSNSNSRQTQYQRQFQSPFK